MKFITLSYTLITATVFSRPY